MSESNKKLTLMSLILMIFTSVFGFTNIVRAYFLMGYSAIPWYILSALTFFIPYAFMIAEFGATFRKETGGIYSWMDNSVNSKYAFVVTFMWFASYIIWMVNVSSGIWVPFTNLIFGRDMTSDFSFMGLSAPKVIALLAILWMLVVTYISSKGLDKIKKITTVGGTFVALINVVLIVGAILVLIFNRFELAQPITATAFTTSPNPAYQTPLSIFSFLVFAIFAYGGLEVVGGLVDKTENPEKTFPRGITLAAIVVAVGYAIGILCVGFFSNWNRDLTADTINMANVSYLTVGNLGYYLGDSLNLSKSVCLQLAMWFSRFVGLSMFLSLTGAFFTLIYSPIKQLIEGTPKELWPEKLIKLDKNGMPVNAMWVQCFIVIIIIALTSFGGDTASAFLDSLILMSNVAMTIPYIFIALAFVPFKKKENLDRPFVIYKSKGSIIFCTILVVFTITFANIFTIVKPILESGDYFSTILQIAGPVIFTAIALILYSRYERNHLKNN